MRDFLSITKALSDPSRVRALLALRGGELCVCWLIELLGLAPSTVSKHMSILAQADLVLCRKEGRWHYYRLPNPPEASALVISTLEWVSNALARNPQSVQDQKQIKVIRKKDKQEVCACYRN